MLKMMTASIAFAALLMGAASTTLAARTHAQNDPVDHQANMLVRDSVGVGASNMKCSIPGWYHDVA